MSASLPPLQSFEKQGFHAGTPAASFSLPSALGSGGPINAPAAAGYAPAPFMHILAPHQQPHSQILHHHLQQDGQVVHAFVVVFVSICWCGSRSYRSFSAVSLDQEKQILVWSLYFLACMLNFLRGIITRKHRLTGNSVIGRLSHCHLPSVVLHVGKSNST